MDEREWNLDHVQSAESPFNMQAILSVCPDLLAHWKRRPFIFELDQHGSIVTSYLTKPPEILGN